MVFPYSSVAWLDYNNIYIYWYHGQLEQHATCKLLWFSTRKFYWTTNLSWLFAVSWGIFLCISRVTFPLVFDQNLSAFFWFSSRIRHPTYPTSIFQSRPTAGRPCKHRIIIYNIIQYYTINFTIVIYTIYRYIYIYTYTLYIYIYVYIILYITYMI